MGRDGLTHLETNDDLHLSIHCTVKRQTLLLESFSCHHEIIDCDLVIWIEKVFVQDYHEINLFTNSTDSETSMREINLKKLYRLRKVQNPVQKT